MQPTGAVSRLRDWFAREQAQPLAGLAPPGWRFAPWRSRRESGARSLRPDSVSAAASGEQGSIHRSLTWDPGTGTLQRFSAGNPGKAGQHQQCPAQPTLQQGVLAGGGPIALSRGTTGQQPGERRPSLVPPQPERQDPPRPAPRPRLQQQPCDVAQHGPLPPQVVATIEPVPRIRERRQCQLVRLDEDELQFEHPLLRLQVRGIHQPPRSNSSIRALTSRHWTMTGVASP